MKKEIKPKTFKNNFDFDLDDVADDDKDIVNDYLKMSQSQNVDNATKIESVNETVNTVQIDVDTCEKKEDKEKNNSLEEVEKQSSIQKQKSSSLSKSVKSKQLQVKLTVDALTFKVLRFMAIDTGKSVSSLLLDNLSSDFRKSFDQCKSYFVTNKK